MNPEPTIPAVSQLPPDGLRILIADDSPVSRRLLEAVLSKWGYPVISVVSGSEAWEILQKEDAPRLAILDWMMPGYSGPEVCSLVRQQGKSYYTYIILLTSRHEKADLITGMESGADDYLVKPFDNNELKVRLGPGRRIIELQSELLKAQEALQDQATRDALTRLWNRRAIFDVLGAETARCHRDGKPLGLVLGDIDKFKSINDTYGHVAGDSVLREVAQRIGASVRPYDGVGRYGGEEFLLVLPGCDETGAMNLAERIRENVQKTTVELPEAALQVTISFGATSLHPGTSSTPESLIRIADEALYQAKQQGRNRSILLPFSATTAKA